MSVCSYLFKTLLSVLLGKNPEVEFQGYIYDNSVFSIFEELTCQVFNLIFNFKRFNLFIYLSERERAGAQAGGRGTRGGRENLRLTLC